MGNLRRAGAVAGALIALGLTATPAHALDNGLALTPPMGYNDWNAFGCNVSAKLIEQTADAMVANGMKDAGYQYVTMDDCWMAGQEQPRGSAARVAEGRDADGNLVPNPANFPDGIKAVADYVHADGLKLGIYEDVGTATCQGLAGSYQHEAQDAKTFASWGVDYLKYDFCNVPTTGEFAGMSQVDIAKVLYGRMRDALAASGRPIVFSMSLALSTGLDQQTWAGDYGNLWRTTPDIQDRFASVDSIFRQNVQYAQYAGPGHWNDPDMLEVGNGGMTTTEYKSHFSLWAIMAAPLIAGSDVRSISPADLAILTNKDVIAVDQDPLGVQGTVVSHSGDQWVLEKDLSGGDKAVLFFNEGKAPVRQSVALADLGLSSGHAVRDLWMHKDSALGSSLTAEVDGHGVAMFRISAGPAPAGTPSHVALTGAASNGIVEPRGATTVTGTLTNDGTDAVDGVALALSAPAGWTVAPVTGAASTVAGGASTSGSWTVGVPPGTAPGTYPLTLSGAGETATVSIVVPPPAPAASGYLSDVPPMSASSSYANDHAVGGTAPLLVGGTVYVKGIGTQQGSDLAYYLGGRCESLTGLAALDDSASATASAEIQLVADGVTVLDRTLSKGAPVALNQSLAGARVVELVVVARSGFGRAAAVDWANAYVNCATTVEGGVGGTVPATLSLILGAPASFGAFTPGVAGDYFASTTATVVSTAGDAALTVADPDAAHPGRLVNGSYAMPQALRVGGSPLPATVKTYAGPVSNDAVTVTFEQPVAATDALRTGTYVKTLTFTLSTTTP